MGDKVTNISLDSIDDLSNKQVEQIERDFLYEIDRSIQENISEFFDELNSSYRFIDYILPPLVSASKRGSTFNPFDEIFEKYLSDILVSEFQDKGFENRPIGYASDVCMESENIVLHIDLKSANVENKSDYRNTIAVSKNQFSYPGRLPIKVDTEEEKNQDISENPIKVFPNLPTEYEMNGKKKLTLSFGVLTIYDQYREHIDKLREEYKDIQEILEQSISDTFEKRIKEEFDSTGAENFLDYIGMSNKNQNKDKAEILADSLYTAFMIKRDVGFIENQLDLDRDKVEKLKDFKSNLESLGDRIEENGPVAILSISIPNGKLSPRYDDKIRSGKNWGASVRYHYGDGKFDYLDDSPRVLFTHLKEGEEGNFDEVFDNMYVRDGEDYSNLKTTLETFSK